MTNCVEVAETPGGVLVRDAAGRVLVLDKAAWRQFIAWVQAEKG